MGEQQEDPTPTEKGKRVVAALFWGGPTEEGKRKTLWELQPEEFEIKGFPLVFKRDHSLPGLYRAEIPPDFFKRPE